MKKLKLIYNPSSGNKYFKYDLDTCIKIFQEAEYETHVFRCGDIKKHFYEMDLTKDIQYDAIVVSGGDGSINLVVNELMRYGMQVPLGIIPSGTANDFATYLKIPQDPEKACEIIARGLRQKVDVGKVNDQYFINVCAVGLLNVSQKVNADVKDTLGKMAYYLKGLEQLPNFSPLTIRVTTPTQSFVEDYFLFLALNSSGTGGFERLSPLAKIDDGLFDFIGIRAKPMLDIARIFIKMLSGEYLDDPGVVFFRQSYAKLELIFDKPSKAEVSAVTAGSATTGSSSGNGSSDSSSFDSDVDGEAGPFLPLEITNIPSAIEIFI